MYAPKYTVNALILLLRTRALQLGPEPRPSDKGLFDRADPLLFCYASAYPSLDRLPCESGLEIAPCRLGLSAAKPSFLPQTFSRNPALLAVHAHTEFPAALSRIAGLRFAQRQPCLLRSASRARLHSGCQSFWQVAWSASIGFESSASLGGRNLSRVAGLRCAQRQPTRRFRVGLAGLFAFAF